MKTENKTFVDYTYVGNRIHYYKYRKGHSPKSKKGYDTVRSAYLDKLKAKHAGNVYLMKLYDICKCPVCDKFHLIPKKVIYDDNDMWKYIM